MYWLILFLMVGVSLSQDLLTPFGSDASMIASVSHRHSITLSHAAPHQRNDFLSNHTMSADAPVAMVCPVSNGLNLVVI